MRRLSCLAVVGAVALMVAGTGAASAGTVTVPVSGWTVAITVNDQQWSSHDCEYVPVTIVIAGAGIASWSVDAAARLAGSGSSNASSFAYGDVPGSFVDEGFYMCPSSDPSGTYEVTGEVTIDSEATSESLKASFATSFVMSPMPTTVTLDDTFTMSVGGGWMEFTGRAVARSATLGDIGVDSSDEIEIEAMLDGTWTTVGSNTTDQLGYFTITVWQLLPADTQHHAVHLESTTGARSVSGDWWIPDWKPSPSVKVKATSGKSKLFVDVNPNKGSGYWTFKVQRQRPDGSCSR